MFDEIIEQLRELHSYCENKLKSENIDLLEPEELNDLFRARDLSVQLANAVKGVASAFYSNKILITPYE